MHSTYEKNEAFWRPDPTRPDVTRAGRTVTVSGVRQVNSGDRASVIPDAFETVTLVDTNDNEIGFCGKLPAHRDGKLHRAFSILVSNSKGELLLQRRASGKYHFASLWSNTCCGHPRPGEDTRAAAERRLWEEFGFNVALQKLDAFQYRAEDTNSGLIEHEYLHVLHGRFNGEPRPNSDEVGAYRWIAPSGIRRLLARRPKWFTPLVCRAGGQVLYEILVIRIARGTSHELHKAKTLPLSRHSQCARQMAASRIAGRRF